VSDRKQSELNCLQRKVVDNKFKRLGWDGFGCKTGYDFKSGIKP